METFANGVHFLPMTAIRRERLLPIEGRVLVRKGQTVNATDVVAEAKLAPEHLLLDVARGLGLTEESADKYIQRQKGDDVGEGDVVAGPVGLGRRVVRAPRAGKVVLAGNGQVLLEVDSQPFELKAGLSGTVTELYPGRGVTIEATGALVQGVWGNGPIDFGILNVQITSPGDVLTAARLDVSLRGSVVLGGHVADAEVLQAAEELPLHGLVLASMAPGLAAQARKVSYPIILIEGFGRLPMNPVVYRLLSTSDRREVALNAQAWDRYANTRPEIIIQLPTQGMPSSPAEMGAYSSGQQVRISGYPYMAVLGTIVEIFPEPTGLPSDLYAPAAQIQLEDGQKVILPLANLEVLR